MVVNKIRNYKLKKWNFTHLYLLIRLKLILFAVQYQEFAHKMEVKSVKSEAIVGAETMERYVLMYYVPTICRGI